MGKVPGALMIVEAKREPLHVRKQVTPQREHKALADSPEKASKIVGQYAGEKSNEEACGARAVENLDLAVRGVIQPGAQERYAARLMGEHTVDHHLQGPGT